MTERVAAYRLSHPKSRVTSAVRYLRNGGTTKQQICILCGAEGPTWCALWPKTKEAERFASYHIKEVCCGR